MTFPQVLEALLTPGRGLRLAASGIYSVIPPNQRHHYDHRAAAYDALVGSAWYNHLLWGNSPRTYAHFAQCAVQATSEGPLLDVGCGSLVFTAPVYAAQPRVIVAVDQSLGMLQRAQRRLSGLMGAPPQHVILLQADLLDLPFRPQCFQTVLCMGMLHLCSDLDSLLMRLQRVCVSTGQIYLTSLVRNARWADWYLRFLHQIGEVAQPRWGDDLRRALMQGQPQGVAYKVRGNMAYAIMGLEKVRDG